MRPLVRTRRQARQRFQNAFNGGGDVVEATRRGPNPLKLSDDATEHAALLRHALLIRSHARAAIALMNDNGDTADEGT